MPELLTVDGFDLRGQAFGVATRTGRYSMPTKRGENLVLPGSSGSRFTPNKPFDEGMGALAVWAIGARTEDVIVARNYQPDPSFEAGLAGYNLTGNGGTTEWDNTRSYSGARSLKTTSTGGSPFGHNGNLIADTTGLSFVTASARVWVPVANVGVGVKIRVGGAGVLATNSVEVTTKGAWTKVSVTVPTTAPGAAVMYLYGSDVAGESVWFDDVSLVGGDKAYNFSGDTEGTGLVQYRWTGAQYASPSERYMPDQLVIPDSFAGQRQAFEENMSRAMRLFTRNHRLSEIRAAQADGSIRRALVEWREWTEPEVMAGGTRGEWAIAYVIPGVWWEDENPTTQSAVAGATLPKTLDLTSFTGMTGIIEDAVLTVTGPITNPRITDAETGSYVEFTGVVSNGQSWVVDVANSTSMRAGSSVLSTTRHTGGYKLFTIPNEYAGSDTPRLILSGTAGGAATNLSVQARRKWVNG